MDIPTIVKFKNFEVNLLSNIYISYRPKTFNSTKRF
jgi:hypothetical protein